MSEDIYLNWPIRFCLAFRYGAWKEFFKWHGIQASGKYFCWVFHFGPLKIVFGDKTGKMLADNFEAGLRAGLSFDGFTKEWMKRERGFYDHHN